MANYPYDQLGTPLDTPNLEKANGNWAKIAADIASVDSSSKQRDTAMTADYTAKLLAQKNEYTGRLDAQRTDYTTGLNAQRSEYTGRLNAQQVDYTTKISEQNSKIDNIITSISDEVFEQVVADNRTVGKAPVANFSTIATIYPNPENGWEVQTLDDGKVYRRVNGSWVYVMELSPGPIVAVNNTLDTLIKTQDYTLPKTIGKFMNTGKKPKIGIMGDSLAEPAGTGIAWTHLLFDSTYRTQGFYLGDIFGDSITPTIAEIDNYAVGGQTSHYGMAYIAPEKKVLRAGLFANQSIDGDALYLPPIIQRKYDLMIISYGTNGGEYSDAFLEILIRQLRLSGTEVMLLTSNPRSDNPNFGFGDNYKKLAKSYSSAVADTQAYFKEAVASGVAIATLLADTVHSAAEGHKLYAKAISDTLKVNKEHYEKGKYPSGFISDRRVKVPVISGELSGIIFPSLPFVQFIPTTTTGTGANANQSNNIKSPINGRYDDVTTKMTKLDVGQYADYTSTQFRGVGLIFYNAVNATVELSTQNGSSLFETINISAGSNRAEYRHVDLSKIGLTDFQNRTIRVKCTSGTAYIVGMVFYSVGHKQQKTLTKTGTWNTATYYNVFSHYTNTANDSMEFEIEGNGFSVDIFNTNAAGIIDVYVDGLKTDTIDLYTTLDDNIYQLRKYGLAYGKHKVKIVLTGSTNPNAIAPSGVKHRLSIFDSVATVYGEDFNITKNL